MHAATAQAEPRRVVSLNLCTDQLLLRLADREQIASLSHLARDRSISYLADQAEGIPVNQKGAETVLFSGADLVLAGTYGQGGAVAVLRRQGTEVLTFSPWANLTEGRAQIRALAQRLGHSPRGEALIAEIDAALARTRAIVKPRRSILAYDRGGWVMGSADPMGEILANMGFALHQDALRLRSGGMARLETIVSSPPDYMLVGEGSLQAIDNATALFRHPALVEAVPPDRRLALPSRLTICGGPATPAAINALAQEVRAKVR